MFMQVFIERAYVVSLKIQSAYLYLEGVDYFESEYRDTSMNDYLH